MQRPDRLQGPSSHLLSGYRGILLYPRLPTICLCDIHYRLDSANEYRVPVRLPKQGRWLTSPIPDG